jgi:hypothetical protein
MTPYCRTGCGLLGNWFSDVPPQLPVANRLKCRQCLGIEIEEAQVVCPECGWTIAVENGVLMPESSKVALDSREEEHLPIVTGRTISRLLGLGEGDLVLILAPLPLTVLEKWECSGVEQVRVELQPEAIVSHRAKSCAESRGVAHYIAGPIEASILRPGEFEAIVATVPCADLADTPGNLDLLPTLLRPSGQMILIFQRTGPRMPLERRIKSYRDTLPESFSGFNISLTRAGHLDLLHLSHPEYEGNNHHPS